MENVESYIKDYFKSVDAEDAAAIASYFTVDGSFRFGNGPAAVGRQVIEQANVDFFGMIGGLHHDIVGIWQSTYDEGNIIFIELAVTYTRKNGTQTDALPVVSQVRMKGDKMHDFRIFGDITPVFEG